MRIAVFSDVHGNLAALRAVLDDIDQRAVDQIIFAGDLCLMGPRPMGCAQLIRERAIPSVYGNTDEIVTGRRAGPDVIASIIQWTAAQLSPETLSRLERLPFALRVQPTANPTDALLITHANPVDVEQIIFPPETEQIARYGRVRQTDVELDALVGKPDVAAIAFGHLHIPNQRRINGIDLVNISSVSMPGDGDGRAKYVIFEWRQGSWSWARQYVEYDADDEIDAYRRSGMPGVEMLLAQIEASGGRLPQRGV